MRCRQYRRRLKQEILSHTDSLPETMVEHVSQCQSCRNATHAAWNLDNTIRAQQNLDPPIEVTEGFWEAVRRGIASTPSSPVSRPAGIKAIFTPRPAWIYQGIAVAVAVMIGIIIIKPILIHKPSPPLTVSIESATIDGNPANISIFQLKEPEMTFIWLDSQEQENGG